MSEVRVNIFAPTRPHDKQKEVLKALDTERFVLLRAGRKFRKTSLCVSWLFEKAFETGLVCPYIAPNRVQAKNIAWADHVERILDEFRRKGIEYKKNEVELSITLPNGGKLQLLGVENKEALRGISNWGAAGLDEYDDWEEDIWPTIIRPNLTVHKAKALIMGTPKGFKNLYRLEQSGMFTPFHFSSYDNPDLDRQELEQMALEYKLMGESYYRQEILADYTKPVGTVYEEWPLEHYVDVEYDPNLPLHVTMDFGVNDPTAIAWIQRNGAEFRVIDYLEESNADIAYFISIIRAKPYKWPELFTGDPAGKARSITSNSSPIEEYAKSGIFIRTRDGVTIPDQVRIMHKHLRGLYISKKAERLRDCIINYRYPTVKESAKNQSNEIPVHDQYSHGMRALEYYFVNVDSIPTNNNPTYIPQNDRRNWEWE